MKSTQILARIALWRLTGLSYDAPADDPAGEDVDDEGGVDEAAPRGNVGSDPRPTADWVGSPRRGDPPSRCTVVGVSPLVVVRGRGPAHDAAQPRSTHQALDGAARHRDVFAIELLPHLLAAVHPTKAGLPHPTNLHRELGIPVTPRTLPRRVALLPLVRVVGGRGDRQLGCRSARLHTTHDARR